MDDIEQKDENLNKLNDSLLYQLQKGGKALLSIALIGRNIACGVVW